MHAHACSGEEVLVFLPQVKLLKGPQKAYLSETFSVWHLSFLDVAE